MTWQDLYPSLTLFPLHPIETSPEGPRCGCGRASCPDVGKHPDCLWSELEAQAKVASRHHPRAGYGIATGQRSGVFVVDCDGASGVDAFSALGTCPNTFTVRRGNGRHYYFKHPGFRVSNTKSKLAEHVDTRGDGGYIVAPGSPHKSGDRYEIEQDVEPTDAPDWLITLLQSCALPEQPAQYAGDVDGETLDYYEAEYRRYLASAPPCVEGQGGDAQLWRVVQYGAYDLGLPGAVVLECIRDIFDHRCEPPWGDELERRVAHKVRCAKEHSTRALNLPLPKDLADCVSSLTAAVEKLTDVIKPEPPADDIAQLAAEFKLTWGDWDKEEEPPKHIVKDIVPAEKIGLIVAKGSSLKTWMALSIGIAVANGDPWLGHFMVQQGRVIIVDYESGRWELRNRAKQLGAQSSPNLALADFPSGRIDSPEFWVKLGRLCAAHGVCLVIVDSFAAGATGVDENDAKAAAPLHLAARFTETCKAAVIFIHHAKKGGGEGDERDLVRGSGAIYAAVDWAVTMIPQDTNRTQMRVRNIKPSGPRPEDFNIKLTEGNLILDVEAREAEPEQEAKDIEASILAVLVRPVATVELLAKTITRGKGETGAYVKALIERRLVAKVPGVGYVLDSEEARVARVRTALVGAPCTSLVDLWKRSSVDMSQLNEWYAKGRLCLSGRQYMFVDD